MSARIATAPLVGMRLMQRSSLEMWSPRSGGADDLRGWGWYAGGAEGSGRACARPMRPARYQLQRGLEALLCDTLIPNPLHNTLHSNYKSHSSSHC